MSASTRAERKARAEKIAIVICMVLGAPVWTNTVLWSRECYFPTAFIHVVSDLQQMQCCARHLRGHPRFTRMGHQTGYTSHLKVRLVTSLLESTSGRKRTIPRWKGSSVLTSVSRLSPRPLFWRFTRFQKSDRMYGLRAISRAKTAVSAHVPSSNCASGYDSLPFRQTILHFPVLADI